MSVPDGRHATSVADGEANVVELRVAARPAMVAMVRAMAANLAGQADFDIDTIADLRLAVDEACGSLIMAARASARLECVFSVAGDAMSVVVGTVTDAEANVDKSGFGWQLLRALTDRVELESGAEGEREWSAIRFSINANGPRP
jgi:serine/threonine-protein kinase RsbW